MEKKSSRLKKIFLIVGIAVLIGLGLLAYFLFNNRNKPVETTSNSTKSICNDNLLIKVKQSVDLFNVDEEMLQPVVEEIEQLKDYEQDPNCLYTVLVYENEVQNAKKGLEVYDKLIRAYDPAVGYSNIISSIARTPEDLKPLMEYIATSEEKMGSMRRGEISGGFVSE